MDLDSDDDQVSDDDELGCPMGPNKFYPIRWGWLSRLRRNRAALTPAIPAA